MILFNINIYINYVIIDFLFFIHLLIYLFIYSFVYLDYRKQFLFKKKIKNKKIIFEILKLPT